MTKGLGITARALVADGKGILAADETPGTLTKRLAALGIESTPESRRTYGEMFFTTPGIAAFISGVILQDETIRQRSSKGIPLAELLSRQGILPGIKVDDGAKLHEVHGTGIGRRVTFAAPGARCTRPTTFIWGEMPCQSC